ncbi:MAG TPA: ATP-binding protein [Actinomycetota bacterium]|nr:ATP-binding protein [Actinomycetota bacterium]
MRPLDPLGSIKAKLGTVIVAAVAVTVTVSALGVQAGLPLVLVAAVAGALALGIVQLLARGMTSPLREMVAATKAMARGDYTSRVTATSRDEVGELARAFNAMASQLAEVDKTRRDLVADVSHELRTPISAIQAVLENMLDGVEPTDEGTLRGMLGQVERLGRLVGQLLDLSRLESGVAPMERREVDLRDTLNRVAHEARPDRGVRIELEAQAGLEVSADPDRVHQVLANLVDNAVRHSPEGAAVMIKGRRSDGRVVIEVLDQGPGIPDADRARVFERFHRAGGAREGGTGLGLAIARWIVDLHGGRIRAEANEPQGCRMVVELPGALA